MYSSDTNKEFIRDLGKGFKLYRCINGGGEAYSYIENENGDEMYSAPQAREAGMLQYFKRMERINEL